MEPPAHPGYLHYGLDLAVSKNGHWQMNLKMIAVSGAAILAFASTTQAATTTVSVNAADGPWQQSVNPTLEYGTLPNDNAAPASVSSGFDFAAGGDFTISYLSGDTTNGLGGSSYDANGQQSYEIGAGYHYDGTSGQPFPGDYTSQNPTYLSQLIGAFANSSGVVVGAPFALGDAATIEVAPVGATQLLLGVNDDIYSDNSGSLLVQVSGPSAVSAAPEPGAWLLMLLGVGAIGIVLRRAKTAFDSGLSGVSAA